MKILRHLRKSAFIFSALLSLSLNSRAQSAEEGAKLFSANCTSCHAIKEKVVGPALKGVHTKYDEAWLIKWVQNSQAMVKAGDPKAVKVFTENANVPMTPFPGLKDNDVKSIIAYIKAESDKKVEAPVAGQAPVGGENASSEDDGSLSSNINWLLLIVSILLIIVLGLVFDIYQKMSDMQGKQAINWYGINAVLLIIFLVVGMAAAIWEFAVHAPLTVNAQPPASAHGANYESMFNITLWLTGIVFVITQILLFWYGYRYKFSAKRKALFYPDNHKLELIWTIIPAIVLTVLVVRGLQTWNSMTNRNQNDKAQVIEVFGYQFNWNVRYAGADNKLGPHDFRQIGVINALGVDTADATSQDDRVTSELHLKVGQPVVLKFRSKDVLHSAFLPHFRVQMNVVPGLPTQFIFTPIVTTAQMREYLKKPEFDYVMLCNKICGTAHYRMKMKIVVESPEDYYKWLSGQPKLVASANSAPEHKALAVK